MSNPYTDPRYELARMMRSKGSVSPIPGVAPRTFKAPSDASVKLSRAANDLALGNPGMQERLRAIAEGRSNESPKGLVAGILNNPVSKVAFNALNVVTIPGRAVVAGLDELNKATDMDPSTEASLSSFVKNVKDVQYGFGTAFNPNTGNKWLDRAIGFAGDVFLDPLTYATFGVGKFAGYSGRLDLANNVLKVTNDPALAGRVARFGRTAKGMNSDILELAGANRYGLHFLGKRIPVGKRNMGVRLPGSGAVGYLGEAGLARLRVLTMDSKAGQLLQKITMPGDFIEARRALASGSVSDSAAGALVAFFNADPVQRIETGRVLQAERTRLANLFDAEKANNIDGYKNSLVDLLESDEAFNAASPELQRAATVYKNIFNEYEDGLLQAIKEVDPTIDPTSRFRQNYFPRIVSDKGLDVLSDPTHPFGSALRTIFQRDPLNGGRNFRARMMEPKDIFFGHKLTAEDLASTTKLNAIARKGGFEGDFFETDITKVLDRYIDEFAKEMGVMARHRHLIEQGFWKRVQEVEVSGPFVDKELVDSLKKRVASLDDDLARSAKSSAEAIRSLEGAIAEAKSGLKKKISEAEKTLDNLQSFDGVARTADQILNEGIDLSDAGLQQVIDQLGTFKKSFAEFLGVKLTRGGKIIPGEGMLDSDVPVVAESLLSVIARTEESVALARKNLDDARNGVEGQNLQKAAEAIAEDIKKLDVEINNARQRMQNIVQYGQILNDNIERAIAGDISGLADNQLKDIGLLLSPSSGADSVLKVVNERFGIVGELQPWLRSWLDNSSGVFETLTRNSPAAIKDDIAKMSKAEFEDILSRALDSKMEPNEIRKAAFYLLGLDERAYAGMMPDSVAMMRSRLENSLMQLDEAMAYHSAVSADISRGGRKTTESIFDTQVQDAYYRVVDSIKELDSLSRFQQEDIFVKMREAVELNPAAASAEFNIESIRPFLNKYPFLNDLFNQDPVDEIRSLMNEDVFVYGAKQSEVVEAPVSKTYTIAEFVDEIDDMIRVKSGVLEQPVYSFGSGVSERAWTGMELKARVEEYNRFKDELARIQSYRRFVADEFFTLSKGPEYQAELKELLSRNVSETDPRVVYLKNQIESLKVETSRRAYLQEYDDLLLIELNKVGYFKAVDPIKKAKLRARAESYYIDAKKARVQKTPKGMTRPGRISIGDRETQILDEIRSISGGQGLVRPEHFDGLPNAQREVADALLEYSVVSEVHSRFAALAQSIAPFGIAPTERMVQGLLNTVAQRHIPRVETKINAHIRAESILRMMDIEVSRSIREGVKPSVAFRSALESLNDAQREMLQEAVGRQIGWASDPRDMLIRLRNARKNKNSKSPGPQIDADGNVRLNKNGKPLMIPSDAVNAENKVFEEFIKPWWKQTYPNETFSKREAIRRLRGFAPSTGRASKSTVSPFSEDASPAAIKQWFESIIGTSEIPGRSAQNKGIPSIELEIRTLRQQESKLRSMLAPDLNIGLWLDDPSLTQRTATWYAYLMDKTADRLDDAISEYDKQVARIQAGFAESAGYKTKAAELDAEIERVMNGIDDIPRIREEILMTQNEISRLKFERGAGTRSEDVLVSVKRSNAEKKLKELKKQLSEASALPKRFESMVARARTKNEAFLKARSVVVDLESKVKTIDERIKQIEQAKYSKSRRNQLIKEKKAEKKRLEDSLAKARKKAQDVDTRSPKEREILAKADSANALEEMAKTNLKYAEIVGDAQYVKAVADQEIYNALMALSEYNLDEFVDGFRISDSFEQGARGLPDRVERFVLMPNGERLVFTKGESASLYRSQLNQGERIQAFQQLKKEQAQIELQIQTQQRRLEDINVEIESRERFYYTGLATRSQSPSALKKARESIGEVVSIRKEIEAELNRLNNILESVRLEYDSLLPSTQASALMKMRILVQGTTVKETGEVVPAVFGPDGLQLWSRGVKPFGTPDPSVSSAEFMNRQYNITNAWSSSSEKKMLEDAQKLRNDIYVKSILSMRSDISALNLSDLQLQYRIDKRVAEADKLLTDVSGVRQSAIREAREAREALVARTGQEMETDFFDRNAADVAGPIEGKMFLTSDSLRNFADNVRMQAAPTGPFVERLTPSQAKAVNANIKAAYDRRISDAQRGLDEAIAGGASNRSIARRRNEIKNLKEERANALASGRTPAQLEYGVRQKEEAKLRRVEAFNAAKETVEQWKKKNPTVIRETEKALRNEQSFLDNLNKLRTRLERIDKRTIDKMNKTFGGTEGYWKQVNDTKTLIEELNNQLLIVGSLTAMPSGEARDIILRLTNKKGGVSTARAEGAIQAYKEWMDSNKTVFEQLAQNPEDPIVKAWANAASAEVDFIWNSYRKFEAVEALMDANLEVWTTRIVQPLADEWEKAARESGLYPNMAPAGKRATDPKTGADISKGFPGLMGNEEAQNLLNKMSTINTPGVVGDLAKFMRGYTGFFRGYATLSPGFHVRNSISNTFALFAAGANIENMYRGFGVWKQIQSGIKAGRTIDDIIDSFPQDQRQIARIAYNVMVGLGGGRTADALEGFVRKGNKLTSNIALDTSHRFGHTLEGSTRFILAYDSAIKGMDETASFNRTGRFLVDYNKKTIIDETMRDIIPFWVWMSRNLPLQVVTRWTNPKPYIMFDKFSKNFNATEEDEVVPKYLRDMGAIGLGAGRFLSLDLPFSRVDEQIQQFGNPKELLTYVNPGIKAPIEFLTNTDTFRDRKFPDTYRKVDGFLMPFAPLLKALGQIEYDSNGNMVTSERAYTTLMNLIPPLSRAERLLPADASLGSQATRSFLGVPYTQVSEGSREAELYKRLAEVNRVGGLQAKADEAK